MPLDLNQICDVCGRPGHVAFRQQVGPYTIVVCHACHVCGVIDGHPLAAEYHSLREQADGKIQRYRKFAKLPGPGDYPVQLPKRDPSLPPVCCGCLGPPDDLLAVTTEPDKPALSGGYVIVAFMVILLSIIFLPAVFKLFVPAMIITLAVRHSLPSKTPIAVLRVPVCRACERPGPVAPPLVRIANSEGSMITACFSNWEYAELLRSWPTAGQGEDR